MPMFDLQLLAQRLDVSSLIALLARHDRMSDLPPGTNFWARIDSANLSRLQGLRICEQEADLFGRMERALMALYGQARQVSMLVVSAPDHVSLYYGVPDWGSFAGLNSVLSSFLPDATLAPRLDRKLGQILRAKGYYTYQGRLYGVPFVSKEPDKEHPLNPWDDVLQGHRRQTWGCLIEAGGIPGPQIVQQSEYAARIARSLSMLVHEQRQVAPTTTATLAGGIEEQALKLTQDLQAELELGKSAGCWQVECRFFAPTRGVVESLAATLRGAFGDPESGPEPVRSIVCGPLGKEPEADGTVLNSRELAVLMQPPSRELMGYAVRPATRFLLDWSPPSAKTQRITMGEILDETDSSGQLYAFDREELTKHVFVSGTTGSGKTNSCFQLLESIWQQGHGVPFLVIEPAKSEYRRLLGIKNAKGEPIIPGLGVFTLGSETAPFRLNPFEMEIMDASGAVPVQRHIDLLKSVFNASFILYAPMPYVLERCLHETYVDKGWDLATGRNLRLPDHKGPLPSDVFPTLTDLYFKIDPVVDDLGYDRRIQADVKAALKTRINSLRIGAKGLLLDVRVSVPISKLLTNPTILELEHIGDDEEKAFVMGLLLIRIYERRSSEMLAGHGTGGSALRHVTVIEEAHRLLSQTSHQGEGETSNARANAVETFTNMLAEIRSFGEGIIVAEQIPTKIARDVIKNTNLKIVHRLIDQEDRDLMGGAMALDVAQKRAAAMLDPGMAIVFGGGDEGAYLVKVAEHAATRSKLLVSDSLVGRKMHVVCSAPSFDPYESCRENCDAMNSNLARCPHHIRDEAERLIGHEEVRMAFLAWALGSLIDVDAHVEGCRRFVLALQRSSLGVLRDTSTVICAVTQLWSYMVEQKMGLCAWTIPYLQSLRSKWLAVAVHILKAYDSASPDATRSAVEQQRQDIVQLANLYRQACHREIGPYVGCEMCDSKCMYRYEVQRLVSEPIWQMRMKSAIDKEWKESDGGVGGRYLYHVCSRAASNVIVGGEMAKRQVAICVAAQSLATLYDASGMLPEDQADLVRGVKGL